MRGFIATLCVIFIISALLTITALVRNNYPGATSRVTDAINIIINIALLCWGLTILF